MCIEKQGATSHLVVEGYISFIGTCLSVCCYVAIICIYRTYKVLRNTGGLIGLIMCCCLLFSDSLHLVGSIIGITSNTLQSVCAAVGVLIHYGLLSAHLCSFILAYDIASKFGGGLPGQRNGQGHYKFCALTFGLPLLIVTVSITLNYTHTFFIGYGERNMCFITNKEVLSIFHTLPVAMITASNIAMVSCTLVQINRQQRASKIALGQSSRSEVNVRQIAIRLIVIVGLTELFGFVILPADTANHGLLIL